MAKTKEHLREAASTARIMAAQAFSRAAGAPLVHGNSIRLLKDAEENYPAWLDAIRSATRTIYFENYIIRSDRIGREFSDALISRAKEGVRVRLLYDWMGALAETSSGYWRHLEDNGVEVRCFNPPRLDSPLGWLSRLHRKSICVDNQVAFISGLCVGEMWVGYPERGIPPWRDTGVEVRGPIVADVAKSFSLVWAEAGPELPADELLSRDSIPHTGDIDLRVLGSGTNTAAVYRLEHLITVLAQKTLWLTDAYFVGTSSYVQALRGAAMDGVDVRLLVPGSSGDLRFLRPISRSGYRPLLEAGIRVFEWNGSMLHAKTGVVDGRWARVGSSNLNIASWMGNWELDIAVENPGFAQEMEQMYLKDLENTTEIVLSKKNRIRAVPPPEPVPIRNGIGQRRQGSASRLTAGAIRVGNTVGAAITSTLVLGAAEAKIMLFGGAALLGLSILALIAPMFVVIPFVLIFGWIGLSLLIKAYHLHRSAPSETNFQNRNEARRANEVPSPKEQPHAEQPHAQEAHVEKAHGEEAHMKETRERELLQQDAEPEARKAGGM